MNFRQVHLDFHTSENIDNIGADFTKDDFQKKLMMGHVNSITVFSKCHHGWSYHPTVKNEIHPNLHFDLLKAQIEAAHEIGVKTPVYLSAGYDEKSAFRHPEWLVRRENGQTWWITDFMTPGYHKLCMNSPYLDCLLEQIKEVCENYDADGIFLDIVGVQPCYCNNCLAGMRKQGLNPENKHDVYEFAQNVYLNYMQKVREAVDFVDPDMGVFHNSGDVVVGKRELNGFNSHFEIEALPTGGWGYIHFPSSARYVQNLGMDYLGMTGKFHNNWGEFGGYKLANALKYEVSLAAAMGAKSSIGDQLHPGGKMDEATYRLIGEAYAQLEEKEEWLDNVKQIVDIGFLSSKGHLNSLDIELSDESYQTDVGGVRILLQGKYLFDVIDRFNDFECYKVIILPDIISIDKALRGKLESFVKNGGKLLASGRSGISDTKDEFVFDFGAEYIGKNPYQPDYFRPKFEIDDMYNAAYVFYSAGEKIRLTSGTELGVRENPYFNRDITHFCSHRHTPNSFEYGGPGMSEGKDGIYIAWHIFSEYMEKGSAILMRIVKHALDRLLQDKKSIKVNLPSQGIVTVMEQQEQERYVHHLLYASPILRGKNNLQVIEDIVAIYNTDVEFKTDKEIKKIYLAPQKSEIPFSQNGATVSYNIEKFECHQMVVLEY